MHWLIVGPYPPELGSGAAAAGRFARERLAAGDDVTALSPRPSAAHLHADLAGLRGIRTVWRVARERGATGLWLRVESGILLRHGLDRRVALVERAAVALLLRRFRESVLDVGDVGLLPGGRAGRPVLRATTRFVVRSGADHDALVASGAHSKQVVVLDVPTAAGLAPEAAPRARVAIDPSVFPAPSSLRGLPADKAALEAAVRSRAAEVARARRQAEAASTGSGDARKAR